MTVLVGPTAIAPSGPTISAWVGVSVLRAALLASANQTCPSAKQTALLVDTGAAFTCVDMAVLTHLHLRSTGTALVKTPSTGPRGQWCPTFDVELSLPDTNGGALHFDTMAVVGVNFTGLAYDGLLGRDVLKHCELTYDGKAGRFSIDY